MVEGVLAVLGAVLVVARVQHAIAPVRRVEAVLDLPPEEKGAPVVAVDATPGTPHALQRELPVG